MTVSSPFAGLSEPHSAEPHSAEPHSAEPHSAEPHSVAAVAGRRVVVPMAGMAWLTVVLLVDAQAGIWSQRLLGVATWLVLGLVLRAELPLVRAQTMVVVVFATVVEYTFSPLLEVYVYRFDNVPAYVPPGHGLVYLAALAFGRTAWVQSRLRWCALAVVTVGGVYAAYGLWWAGRTDVLGAFWFCCLLGFLAWGPSRGLYVGAFVVVSYLEIAGTALGTWTWQPYDPTGLVSIGNPPSGAAGGYGWFDLVALLLGPRVLAYTRRLAPARRLVNGTDPCRSHALQAVQGSESVRTGGDVVARNGPDR